MFARLFALPACLFICLLTLMPLAPAQAVGLPSLLNSADKNQPQPTEPLAQSLDEVIKNLENDQQRSKLLSDLKKLRDSTKKAQPVTEEGVLGLIGSTLSNLEKQFTGTDSPLNRWSQEFDLAQEEMLALMLPASEWLPIIFAFALILLLWSFLAWTMIWLSHRVRLRFGLTEELPQHPRTVDLLRFALRKLGPWMIALLITVYMGYALPSSLGKDLAMVLAYALVVGTCFSAICVIAFSVLDGPHRHQALHILRHRAFRPLWLIGSFAAFGEALGDPRLVASLGSHLAHTAATFANVMAALSTGLFILRFRRPIAHLIRNQPLSRRLTRRALSDTIEILGTFWFVPALILVAISLFATFVSAGDTSTALRQSLICTVLVVLCMVINGLVRRHALKPQRGHKRHALYSERLKSFCYTLVHLFVWLVFIELGLRVWGMSLIRFTEGEGHEVSVRLFSLGGTLIFAWLVWILSDTAVHHALTRSRKGLANARAQTMMPLIRNVLFVAIFIIALIVALANMGMNVTPLLAGAGVIGLAIGFGAQSLVADLITGLFIIIEDSLAIDDYVDVGGHLGTVEGLTIRTVRLRDIDGIVHTIPFSEIKSIKNYSREFGYAIFRVAIPYNMPIDDAIKLMRDVGQKMRTDPLQRRNIWSPLEIQGVESFESGSAILRARFKTAPIKQWEVSRAFNLSLKRTMDEAGLDLATPRLSVQVVTAGGGPETESTPKS
ncbi:mechanosensitive ion channel family protein [Pseudomonas gingeri NCPPB 3146 = LMG 5327]|uniref:Mechanosensitive ion channel family protein n=4 Tax=Pseudomonas gingeri TaxID=117681 RepID=A0A7Y7Y0X1_9PSED|nr:MULTISPECIES: mechanosensitive ion channel domain-containing protein [Pseudomonas]NVZ26933.1 mechanosensitive ion channel family protein [Pseudomonas gingeri]NWA09952.1 mechanosensitive ion channel family protein [Pseudomonas gingeri]NWC15918.1 mechanosensitive ion channel family protein [Pseudomonas gingeri]NWE45944.1 mechanosensitive ion channel family protein [Pseudomonas gingeri]PNQ91474.1 mechanosensitive ion channel family protein [Pseudomonas gingeri NCPPB 3146 = LMG 5327]